VRKANARPRGPNGERIGEIEWRYGALVAEHETPGVWMAKFEDAENAEKLDCGRANRYEANPMPPVMLGHLEEIERDGRRVVKCMAGLSGDNPLGEFVIDDGTRVQDIRRYYERKANDPNGLKFIHKKKDGTTRVLNDYEDSWNWVQSVQLNNAAAEEQHVLELFSVEKDGTQTLFWHSSMPPPTGPSPRPRKDAEKDSTATTSTGEPASFSSTSSSSTKPPTSAGSTSAGTGELSSFSSLSSR
jgi:hypothetical protein